MEKVLLLFFGVALTSSLLAQSIDIGFDLKINQNFLHNRTTEYEVDSAVPWPRIADGDPYNMVLPNYAFGFRDDFNDTVFVQFSELKISNNFEVPISFRFNTKNNWYFDLKLSTGKYTMDYVGQMFQNKAYYFDTYGTVDDYLIASGGEPYNPIIGLGQNNVEAYVLWFNEQVENDPWSQATVRYQEEIKFRTAYLGAGRTFLSHKVINPFIYVGAHYKLAVSNYKRTRFEIREGAFGQTSKRDLSIISNELPTFSNSAFGFRADIGAKFYRYRVGFSGEMTFNQTDKELTNSSATQIFNYENPGFGFWSLGFYIGIDLQSFDLNANNRRSDVYEDEFKSLAEKLNRDRKWGFVARIKAPIVSGMTTHDPFTLIDYKETYDAYTDTVTINWHSLTFLEMSKVNWSPKLELGLRYSPFNRFDVELQAGLTRLEADNKVQEIDADIQFNNTTGNGSFKPGFVQSNLSAYRVNFWAYSVHLNLYYTVIRHDLLELRVHGGGGLNVANELTGTEASTFGVNGDGVDVYDNFNELYWGYENYTFGHQNILSEYGGSPNLDNGVIAFWDPYLQNSTGYVYELPRKSWMYFTATAGVELEVNKFLFGASTEFTVVDFDGILIDQFYNVNLSIGYMLFSKNRLHKNLGNEVVD